MTRKSQFFFKASFCVLPSLVETPDLGSEKSGSQEPEEQASAGRKKKGRESTYTAHPSATSLLQETGASQDEDLKFASNWIIEQVA